MSPLVLNVAELLRRPGTERQLDVSTTTTELGLDDPRLPEAPVTLAARLDVLSDGIVVAGTVSADWSGQCRRCLRSVAGRLNVEVHELYQARVTDPDAFLLEHDQLDLRPMVTETLLLEAPGAPLCRPDCAGLCPACGVDRNVEACSCDTTPRDLRWSALDALGKDSR
jgi:uncharacterized protein